MLHLPQVSSMLLLAGISISSLQAAQAQAPAVLLRELNSLTPTTGDAYGADVAIEFDVALVGSPLDDDQGTDAGAVYVFREAGGAWGFSEKIYSPDPDPGDRFGASVDIYGSRLAIGAPGDDERALDAGAAYQMVINSLTGLVVPQGTIKVVAVDGGAGDAFGVVGIAKDTFVIGAPSHDLPSQDSGAVYVYAGNNMSPNLQAGFAAKLTKAGGSRNFGAAIDVSKPGSNLRILIASDGRATLFSLGQSGPITEGPSYSTTSPSGPPSVAYSQPFIAVGEPTKNSRTGEVRIYREATPAVPVAIVTADDSSAFDEFGASIAGQAGRFLIGAPFGDWPGVDHGSAYLLEIESGLTGTWPSVARHLDLPLSESGDRVGESVALARDFPVPINLAMVGGTLRDLGSSADAGSAWIFGLGITPRSDFCFGAAGPPSSTCASCPCGNAPALIANGGCLNSGGRSGRLNVTGFPSPSMDTLRFDLRGATSNSFAVLLSGQRQLPAAPACAGGGIAGAFVMEGLRCVGTDLVRHGTRLLDGNGDSIASWGGGPGTNPPGGLVAQSGAIGGQTRYWQAIYREEPLFGCGSMIHSSQGIRVLYQP